MRVEPPIARPPEGGVGPFGDEALLRAAVAGYLSAEDRAHVERALDYAHRLHAAGADALPAADAPGAAGDGRRARWDPDYVVSVALALAETVHVDAVSLGAVLLYQAVELGLAEPAAIPAALGGPFGTATARLVASIERFDALQRPAAARRRAADRNAPAERDDPARERRRERQRREEDEAMRKMFVGLAEDPRVVIFKIADQLCTMRAVRAAADVLRAGGERPPAPPARAAHTPPWTLAECLAAARETRSLYAPLAGRLGLGRMESELEDLAFAVLEPDEYRWLSEAVAEEQHQRRSYVDRVCAMLRDEMARIGLRAEVSGRVKHLYSIFRKVQRTGNRDLSQLYDIVAFRIIVDSPADCYLALGHIHQLWRPKDGRIKDFIANPKPNGYRSLHTTVFCLDERLAEIQIRTRDQHQTAEYGLAMHWHYKEAGDEASAADAELRAWLARVVEWQQELRRRPLGPASGAGEPPRSEETIFVFTPAGDPKELPAGSTPLDFAYRIHSDVGDHCSGARVTTEDGGLVTRMVPLDYELRSGDTVEILTNKHAHPTRDWLSVVRTKAARSHVQRYLKAHERHIDEQIGRERLDRDLKAQGLRGGLDDLRDEELLPVARDLGEPDVASLLVALGNERLRTAAVISRLRERLPERLPPLPEAHAAEPAPEPARAPEDEALGGVDVAGVAGLYTRLATCCSPVPGDQVLGFITRGRGVVVHRTDCPNLAALLKREPERTVAVSLADLDGSQAYKVPIVVQAADRPGLLADVTGVIAHLKINMVKVTTTTNPAKHTATISAVLELSRADQLDGILRALLAVKSVLNVERRSARKAPGEPGGRSARRKP